MTTPPLPTPGTLRSSAGLHLLTISDRCTACGACLATCPETALLPAPGRPVVARDRCTDCMECLEVCPAGAIEAMAIQTVAFDAVAS